MDWRLSEPLGVEFFQMADVVIQTGTSDERDLARLAEIKTELAKLPKATGERRHIGGIKWGLYAESRRIRSRQARRKGKHTKQDWLDITARQQGRCAKCNEKRHLTKDHILPISQGGSDATENIQGLCGSCNSKKGAWDA